MSKLAGLALGAALTVTAGLAVPPPLRRQRIPWSRPGRSTI